MSLSDDTHHHTRNRNLVVHEFRNALGLFVVGYSVYGDTSNITHSWTLRVSQWWVIGLVCPLRFQPISRSVCVCQVSFPLCVATDGIHEHGISPAILITKWSTMASWYDGKLLCSFLVCLNRVIFSKALEHIYRDYFRFPSRDAANIWWPYSYWIYYLSHSICWLLFNLILVLWVKQSSYKHSFVVWKCMRVHDNKTIHNPTKPRDIDNWHHILKFALRSIGIKQFENYMNG